MLGNSSSYYKLGNFSVCVCLCVCVSVRLFVSTFLNRSSPTLEGTFYGSWHVPWAIYLLCALNVHARACVLSARTCVHSLIFERILSKFAGNILRLTISCKDYILFMFTHRAYACEHTCARARVIKRSLIYGQILFTFAVNILQVTSSSMGSVLFMLTHRAHACERACTSGRVVKTFTYLWTDSFLICWAHTTKDHKLHGLHTYHVHAPQARGHAVQARVISCSLTYGRFLFK
jgi:hypothetical protein